MPQDTDKSRNEMKNIIKFASLGLLGFVLASCAETDIDYFEVAKPQSIADYEYLDEYNPLKEYINRANIPGFTLGAGVSADDYILKGVAYRLVNHNFDMITPDKAMLHGSVVDNDGNMDFSTVETFVKAAEDAGMQIYGQTLCCDSQQNTTWLNNLIKDLKDDEYSTVAQKQDSILDAELARWIDGIMVATEGKVKVWDVVKGALSEEGDYAELKHMATENNSQCFYWQDYLGDDYVRRAVKYARASYAAIEGTNPADLKLFVSDKDLEGVGSEKVKSLISWINRWEADGTKIDGIGTQMHVTYSLNADAQKENEAAVVDMFKELNKTGKLIRITELNMAVKKSNKWYDDGLTTSEVTLEQLKAMGEFYNFIVKKYFELIDKDKQFGICQWCITDTSTKSDFRKDQPVGLWNLSYSRKPAYGSFCDALKAATDNNK